MSRRGRPTATTGGVKPEPVDDDAPIQSSPAVATGAMVVVLDSLEQSAAADFNNDNDPIVREIDVYLSPALSETAALVQFPLRPGGKLGGGGGGGGGRQAAATGVDLPQSARTKPRHTMLELDFALPTTDGPTNARRFGLSSSSANEELLGDTRTFASHSVPVLTHMALGKLDADGSRLDLIPLRTVLQMRPTFDHLDANDPEAAASAQQAAADEAAAASSNAKPLLFRKKESDRSVSTRRSSYAHLQSDRASEDWIDLDVISPGAAGGGGRREPLDPQYVDATRKIPCPNRGRTVRLVPTTAGGSRGYVRSLNYLPVTALDDEVDEPTPASWASSPHDEQMSKLKQELTAKIATLLSDNGGVPVPYPVLRSRFLTLPPPANAEDGGGDAALPTAVITDDVLIECASSAAVLVRGNFVLRSDLMGLCPDSVVARDVCLVLLNKYGRVARNGLAVAFGMEEAEGSDGQAATIAVRESTSGPGGFVTVGVMNKVFEPLAMGEANGMEFRVEDDVDFCVRYSSQAEMHRLYWERREAALASYVRSYEEHQQQALGIGA